MQSAQNQRHQRDHLHLFAGHLGQQMSTALRVQCINVPAFEGNFALPAWMVGLLELAPKVKTQAACWKCMSFMNPSKVFLGACPWIHLHSTCIVMLRFDNGIGTYWYHCRVKQSASVLPRSSRSLAKFACTLMPSTRPFKNCFFTAKQATIWQKMTKACNI